MLPVAWQPLPETSPVPGWLCHVGLSSSPGRTAACQPLPEPCPSPDSPCAGQPKNAALIFVKTLPWIFSKNILWIYKIIFYNVNSKNLKLGYANGDISFFVEPKIV